MKDFLGITTYGMDILRRKASQVEKVDEELIMLIDKMFKTMINANGIGLAAPQVNLDRAIAIVDISDMDEGRDTKPFVMINPVIVEATGEDLMEEGCLSIPGVRAKVLRPERIVFKYKDLDMKDVKVEADRMLARVVQHEIDHLNGKLFIDYLSPAEKKKIREDLNKIKKGEIDPDYPLHINAKKNLL
jgi:peptide deformylase